MPDPPWWADHAYTIASTVILHMTNWGDAVSEKLPKNLVACGPKNQKNRNRRIQAQTTWLWAAQSERLKV
jgi:hypothetical protein